MPLDTARSGSPTFSMGGSASKPDKPPPAPAPVRADTSGGEQAITGAARRNGLRKTILDQQNEAATLGAPTALGSMGQLGLGGQDGAMINTRTPPKFTQKPNGSGGRQG